MQLFYLALGSALALASGTAVIFLHKIKHLSNEKEISMHKLICEEVPMSIVQVEMCEVKSLQQVQLWSHSQH